MGSEAAVEEAASMVVENHWPQAWRFAQIRAGFGRLTSVIPEGRDKTGRRDVDPAVSMVTLSLGAPGYCFGPLSCLRGRIRFYPVGVTM